jgi:hypothetical protein
MANSFMRSRHIAASADDTWAVVGDSMRLPEWFGIVTQVRLEGDRRIVGLKGGAELSERFVSRDDTSRRYVYEVESGASTPMSYHRAGFDVEDDGSGGSVVRWWTDARTVDPEADLEERLGPAFDAGLESLANLLEGS